MSSLTEAIETLFDDSGLGKALDDGVVFNRSIDEKMLLLGDWLSAVDAVQPVPMLLRDEAMVRCRALATEILDELTRGHDVGSVNCDTKSRGGNAEQKVDDDWS